MATEKERNAIKQSHYRQCVERRKAAFRANCFYECMLIDYAMIEDRLLSILAHAGLAKRVDESSPGWSKKNIEERRALLGAVDVRYALRPPSMRNISTKLLTVRALCEIDYESLGIRSVYAKWVDEDVRAVLAKHSALELCDRIEQWKSKRNVYVHALFGNVPYGTEDDELKAFAEEGYLLARQLDKISSSMRAAEKRYKKRKALAYKEENEGRRAKG